MVVLFTVNMFAATTDLAERFLEKANEAFENDQIDEAYKYVNQALAVAKDEDSQANVVFFAQTVYTTKLQKIQKSYDDMTLIDIKTHTKDLQQPASLFFCSRFPRISE